MGTGVPNEEHFLLRVDTPFLIFLKDASSLLDGRTTERIYRDAGRVRVNPRPPSISTSRVPPWASARPLATKSPTLLPPPVPGALGRNSASAPWRSSCVPARNTRTR